MSICSGSVDHYNNGSYFTQPRGFLTPPPTWRRNRCAPAMPVSERKPRTEPFHAMYKVPSGDSPYVRAKQVQLIDKDPRRAISLFWAAINSGDRVDSALKDMAVVMKQLDRSDEAIEAIKSFRYLCPHESQESLDNILLELYKQSGRIEEEIEMLQVKLKQVEEGIAFGGKRTKMAKSQGKRIHIPVEKEYARLLGNLGWAYMQNKDFKSAEEYYRKALTFKSDKNKQCNLAICLIHLNRLTEAKFLLQAIRASCDNGDESCVKSYERASQVLAEFERKHNNNESGLESSPLPDKMHNGAFSDFPYEKRVDLNWRTNHCQKLIRGQGQAYTTQKRAYESSPFCNRNVPKVPFTQPRRCSQSGNPRKEDRLLENGYGISCRKLSFGSSTGSNENAPPSVNQNSANHYSGPSPNGMQKVIPTFSQKHFPSTDGEWRKNSADELDGNSGFDGHQKSTFNYYSAPSPNAMQKLMPKFSEKHFLSTDGERRKNSSDNLDRTIEFVHQKSSGRGEICNLPSDSVFSLDIKDEENLTNLQTGWRKTCEHKKSWADMVEEEERNLEMCMRSCSSKESRCFGEGLKDENVDCGSNVIIPETPNMVNEAKKLSEKIGLMDLGNGYCTQPGKTTTLKLNQLVRRSLCFDKNQEQGGMEEYNCTSSPLLEDVCSTKSITMRNRLQVFQDITHASGGPKH